MFDLPKRKINTKFYSLAYKNFIETELKTLEENVSNKDRSLRILDLGSYDGRVGFIITDILLVKPLELYLTDYNEDYLNNQICPNVLEEEEFIKIQKEDVTNLSFPSDQFDIITSMGDTFSLIYKDCYGGAPNNEAFTSDALSFNFIKSVSEALRVLKKDGVLLFGIDPAFLPDYEHLLSEVDLLGSTKKTKVEYGTGRYIITCKKKQ